MRPNFEASIFNQKNSPTGKILTLFIGPWINSYILDKPRFSLSQFTNSFSFPILGVVEYVKKSGTFNNGINFVCLIP